MADHDDSSDRATGSAPAAPLPLPAAERIEALDVLRGFALFGIFIMNMPGFTHSLFTPPDAAAGRLDAVVVFMREAFFAGKFNLLFGMLFGVGFTLQLARLENARPGRAGFVYGRRLAVLLCIGLIHAALLWSGDVLLIYALLGFALLALNRLPQRVVLGLVVACLLLPPLLDTLRPYLFSARLEATAALDYQDFEASNNAAFGHGSFVHAVRETARVFAWYWSSPFGLYSYAAFSMQMATGVLLGLCIGRAGWVRRLPALGAGLRALQLASLAVALAGGGVLLLSGVSGEAGDMAASAAAFVRPWARLALATFYATSLLRLLRVPGWARALKPLAIAGRMPLSNYLLQTALGLFIFYDWGLGWWGRATPPIETLLAVALFFVVQLPLSAWWLGRFRYGPVEWLWRRLTYGKLAPRR